MRARLILGALGAAVAVAVTVVLVAGGDEAPPTATRTAIGPGLVARTVTADQVTVKVEPHHLDGSGARFAVTVDTHATDLGMDLAAGARLVVGGTVWPAAGWEGDGPGGHHREGTLRFDPSGTAAGPARLSLDGFGSPVDVEWTLEGVTP